MNAPRIALERAQATFLFGRVLPSVAHSARPCRHLLRPLTYSHCHNAPEKVQTTTSFQPYPLPRSLPPQPRSDNIPETSIASPDPAAREPRAAQQQQSQPASPSAAPAPAVSEAEAQQTKPVAATDRKRKFKPRKAALKLTPAAVEQLRELLDGPEPKLIKVGVRNRGCSGLSYQLDYVDKAGAFDESVDQDGVKVLIDSKALFSVIGSEMDYVEDKLSQRFVFRNPNIKEECGCGESFMV